MTDYMVRFKAHIIPALKPEDWPNPILTDSFFSVDSFKVLADAVNNNMKFFIRQGGIIFLKEAHHHLGENIETMNLRVYVPMHMISHIEQETTKMMGIMPDPEGEETVFQ